MESYNANVIVPVSVPKPPPSLAVSASVAPTSVLVPAGTLGLVTTTGVALTTLTTTVSVCVRRGVAATTHAVPESTLLTSARADVTGTG